MLRINRVASMKGVEHVWEVMLSRDTVFVDLLEFIPIGRDTACSGTIVPEMHHKCLKLTLHLPYPQLRMINLMLLYGLVVLLICFAANYVLMTVYMQGVLAPEHYSRILLTALPWYLAGIAAYLLISWICLEPTWKRRVLNLVISVLLLRIFFLAPAPEAYNAFLPWLAIYTLLTASLLMALHCTVQGRRTRLTGYTFTIKNEKDNETF